MALSAYVLIDIAGNKAKKVFKALSGLDGVKSVNAVTGPYDMIAHVEASDINGLGNMVLSKIQGVDGVKKTITCVVVEIT